MRTALLVLIVALLVPSMSSDAEARRRRKGKGAKTPAAEVRDPAPGVASSAIEAPGEATVGDGAAAATKTGAKGPKGPKVMDFTGLDVEGKLRTPQLLYFLGRAKEELDRASLERRSFMPELSRSLDEGGF